MTRRALSVLTVAVILSVGLATYARLLSFAESATRQRAINQTTQFNCRINHKQNKILTGLVRAGQRTITGSTYTGLLMAYDKALDQLSHFNCSDLPTEGT